MEASVRELKARLSEYLRQVAAGEEVVVTSRGKPVARLTAALPVPKPPEQTEAEAITRLQSLPWIRPGDGKKVRGADRPISWQPGQKTLSDMVLEDRE
jgi:prevent-host-death family protein